MAAVAGLESLPSLSALTDVLKRADSPLSEAYSIYIGTFLDEHIQNDSKAYEVFYAA